MLSASAPFTGRIALWKWSVLENTHSASSPRTNPEQSKPRGGFRFAAATLLVLGLVATFAPFLAASFFGVAIVWDGQRSSGGVVALVASIAMWIWCRSWEAWRRWIWLPIVATVIAAFALVGSNAAGNGTGGASLEDTSTHQQSGATGGTIMTPPPVSDAQATCESQGYTWDTSLKCITTVGQQLRDQGWGSTEAAVGRIYYSFGGDPVQCGDHLCQTLIFHSDNLSSCPDGIVISPTSGHEGIEGTKIDQLAVNSEVQISLKVPLGEKDIYFAYEWACR